MSSARRCNRAYKLLSIGCSYCSRKKKKKANGKVQICADYLIGLNNSLDAHQYPLPVPEDILTKLNGEKGFAKIHFCNAFLQLEVEKASKELLTIKTHKGLFRL